MLCAAQIFNNPLVTFKSECFIVLSNIAWTYLLHAYYCREGIEYRYLDRGNVAKTKHGADKFWGLEDCLNYEKCPIDETSKSNLKFLIELRHEIEHRMTKNIDNYINPQLQACCINYNKYIEKLFPDAGLSIDKCLPFALQFYPVEEEQARGLVGSTELPTNVSRFISDFESELGSDRNDSRYAYRFYYKKLANHEGGADKVIEFIPADSPQAEEYGERQPIFIKDREPKKYLPGEVCKIMQEKGYKKFKIHHHTKLWKQMKAKDPAKKYGVFVSGRKVWYWYDKWVEEVEKHCRKHFAPTAQ